MSEMGRRVDEILGRMDLKDKAGQCLVCNFTGTVIEDYHIRFVREFRCGGLRVTPHITGINDEPRVRKLAPYHTPGQYASVLKALQDIALARASGIPLQMVTDQEGDLSVDILRGGVSLFPSNAGLAATGDPGLVERAMRVVGRQLRAMGVHWIHSPVLDVNLNPRNPEIGMRAFSDDPQTVATYGAAVIRGLHAEGIVATGKHFPGRGDSALDAHDTLDVLNVDRARLDAVELAPYRALIPRGLAAIMSAHNAYPALDDSGAPASVSERIIRGLVRDELGFDGVVTTDAIGMAGLMTYAGNQWNATVMALEAGIDIVLVKADEAVTGRCFAAILAAVKDGRLSEARLDESVRRILTVKARAGILDHPVADPEKADGIVRDPDHARCCREVFRRGSLVIRDRDGLLPLDPGGRVLVVEPYIEIYHEKGNDAWYHPGMCGENIRRFCEAMVYQEMRTPPTEEDLARFHRRVRDVETVIFFNVFWRGSGSNRKLIRESVRMGKRVIVVTNDLYDGYYLEPVGTLLCVFGAVPEACRVASELLYGKTGVDGQWPLSLIRAGDVDPGPEPVDHFVAGYFAAR